MLEISSQVEIKDTRRNVYTQCGGQGGIKASVIAEYKTMKEINARSRAVLVFCECSSSVHLFQINTEMPNSRFKHICCNPFNKKIIVEKGKKKICVAFRP